MSTEKSFTKVRWAVALSVPVFLLSTLSVSAAVFEFECRLAPYPENSISYYWQVNDQASTVTNLTSGTAHAFTSPATITQSSIDWREGAEHYQLDRLSGHLVDDENEGTRYPRRQEWTCHKTSGF